jgi:hypothetical protein
VTPRIAKTSKLRAVSIGLVMITHVIVFSPFIYERVAPLFQYATFGVGVIYFSASRVMLSLGATATLLIATASADNFGQQLGCSGYGAYTGCCHRRGYGW